MKKKIVSLTASFKSGSITFNLGQPVDQLEEASGRTVNHIEFKRDGIYGITKGSDEESHYAITLMNTMTEKDFVTLIVLFSKMDRLVILDVESDKDKPAEVPESMQKVD